MKHVKKLLSFTIAFILMFAFLPIVVQSSNKTIIGNDGMVEVTLRNVVKETTVTIDERDKGGKIYDTTVYWLPTSGAEIFCKSNDPAKTFYPKDDGIEVYLSLVWYSINDNGVYNVDLKGMDVWAVESLDDGIIYKEFDRYANTMIMYDALEGRYIVSLQINDCKIYITYTNENVPVVPMTLPATPTASKVFVNGENVSFDAYNINGNNYFKLRDLAFILSGTEKQFEVGWDGANNAISLTSGEKYTPNGGEMAKKGAGNQTATPTTAKIYLDGKEISLTAYNIGGNNYFKLRDIGQTFDFGVT